MSCHRNVEGGLDKYLEALLSTGNLHLNLHRQWFAEIAAGTKTTEYRDATPFWRRRLAKPYATITFRNGYRADSPEMVVECRGIERHGKQFHIRLGRVLSIHRWPPRATV